jgi:endonuclease YncB( thermonuclease family)
MPRLSAVRLVVLLGILAAIFVKEGLGLEILPASNRFSSAGGGQFTLCGRGNQAQCVVDGDTIHYAGLKIRLEDIDAPETYQYKCESELALGKRATNRLLELVNAGPFELINRGSRDEDRYGRKLRTIERGGRSLGEILVAEGLARRWDGARRSWCS